MCMANCPRPRHASGSDRSKNDEIDFSRIVWDQEYRRSIIRRLEREANDNEPAADS